MYRMNMIIDVFVSKFSLPDFKFGMCVHIEIIWL